MRYRFGECEFDTERYELRRAGQVVALAPLAMRVLTYFVQHPGQAVAKAALWQAFWPGAAEERYKEYSLRNCLAKIRQAVGDAGTLRAVIETVQRYGYRFTAEVTVLPTPPYPAEAGEQGPTDATVSPDVAPAVASAVLPEVVVRCPAVPDAHPGDRTVLHGMRAGPGPGVSAVWRPQRSSSALLWPVWSRGHGPHGRQYGGQSVGSGRRCAAPARGGTPPAHGIVL
jgi:DNA-binding winged helix-turn-helix (wHTH) protein